MRNRLERKTQKTLAREEGVTRQEISRRVRKAATALDPEFIQNFRNRLTELADSAFDGLQNHLSEPKPDPRVLVSYLEGMTFYRREIDGSLAITALTDAELADRTKRFLSDATRAKA